METHKVETGSIIGHGGRDCECGPKRVVHFDGRNSGRFAQVTYIHYNN